VSRLLCVFAAPLLIAAAACTNQNSIMTAPSAVSAAVATPVPPSLPTPTPATLEIGLAGRVSESVPTFPTGIEGAIVTINDGPNAGRSAITDHLGFYAIRDLQPSTMTIAVSAEGFVGASRSVGVDGPTASNFELTPVPQVQTHTMRGSVAAGDGTCSDGASEKPCRIVVIPIHNPGAIDATLTWTSGTAVDLDVTLFQTNVPTPLAKSTGSGSASERVTGMLSIPSTYELRITYSSGTDEATYTLTVTHLN
jgi:hypothetical protein